MASCLSGSMKYRAPRRSPCVLNDLRCLLVSGLLCLVPEAGFGERSPVILTPDEDGIQRIMIFMDRYSFSPRDIIIQTRHPVVNDQHH